MKHKSEKRATRRALKRKYEKEAKRAVQKIIDLDLNKAYEEIDEKDSYRNKYPEEFENFKRILTLDAEEFNKELEKIDEDAKAYWAERDANEKRPVITEDGELTNE